MQPVDVDLLVLTTDDFMLSTDLTYTLSDIRGGTASLLPDGRTARFTSSQSTSGFIYNISNPIELAADTTFNGAKRTRNPSLANWKHLVHAAPLRQWTHVAVSYQNGTPTLLLDGKKVHQGLKGLASIRGFIVPFGRRSSRPGGDWPKIEARDHISMEATARPL